MPHKTNQVRIIAGKWRGRKIHFPAMPGLRPTPDSVKETLFNWLAPYIKGKSCLDCFAGSGALGFEALSRGAEHVVMIDRQISIIKQLKQTATQLQAEKVDIIQGAAPYCLKYHATQPFDIVFLDPPFNQQIIENCVHWLENNNHLNKNAYIYMEAESLKGKLDLHNGWQMLYNKKSGRVSYYLFQRI